MLQPSSEIHCGWVLWCQRLWWTPRWFLHLESVSSALGKPAGPRFRAHCWWSQVWQYIATLQTFASRKSHPHILAAMMESYTWSTTSRLMTAYLMQLQTTRQIPWLWLEFFWERQTHGINGVVVEMLNPSLTWRLLHRDCRETGGGRQLPLWLWKLCLTSWCQASRKWIQFTSNHNSRWGDWCKDYLLWLGLSPARDISATEDS